MHVVGRRRTDGAAVQDQGRLARTAGVVRRTRALVPRGVFRFASFEEADTWMLEMTRRTHARLNPKTSSASVDR